MSHAMMIFRFPPVVILGSALCCAVWAQQPPPEQSRSAPPPANQDNSAATHKKPDAPATNPPSTAVSGKHSSTTVEPSVNTNDEAGNQEPNKDKDADAGTTKRKTHFHLGTVTVGVGYAHFPGGFFSPFYPFGLYAYAPFYSPFYDDPFYGSFYYPSYAPNLNESFGKGQVRLLEPGTDKNAEVYIDEAYAGTVRSLKSMWLDPGVYDISIKGADGSSFQQRIYVLSGKTVRIKPELKSEYPVEDKK
jgi:hypothetical protein